MLRKVLLVLSGNAAASLLLFARNLLVARMLPVEDYGIAATFAIAMAVVEMASQLGLQQQIIQARDGNDPRFQAALQGFQVLRGLLSGGTLFLAAGLIADLLRVPEAAWAYQLMALIPVLNALQHFDIHRLSRELRFWPQILTGAVPALLSLLALWPLARMFGDYRVMLYAMLLQAVLGTAISHLVAERRYQLVLDRQVMRRSLRFGWPLLLNGLLLFAVFQGDRLIVAREFGIASLAIFSMGVTLTLTPMLVLVKSTQSFFLPQLSAAAHSRETRPERFDDLAQAVLQAAVLNGALLVLGVTLLGPPLIDAVLGDKFAPLLPLLCWFSAQQGLRMAKAGPTTVALAAGLTSNAMLSNAVRAASLPLIWWAAREGYGLTELLALGTFAEALGFALALTHLARHLNVSCRASLPAIALLGLFMLAIWMSAAAPGPAGALPVLAAAAAPWAAAAVLAFLPLSMVALRRQLRHRG